MRNVNLYRTLTQAPTTIRIEEPAVSSLFTRAHGVGPYTGLVPQLSFSVDLSRSRIFLSPDETEFRPFYKTLAAARQPGALYLQFDVEVNDDPHEFTERNETLTTVVNGAHVPAVRVMVNLYTPNDTDSDADLTFLLQFTKEDFSTGALRPQINLETKQVIVVTNPSKVTTHEDFMLLHTNVNSSVQIRQV